MLIPGSSSIPEYQVDEQMDTETFTWNAMTPAITTKFSFQLRRNGALVFEDKCFWTRLFGLWTGAIITEINGQSDISVSFIQSKFSCHGRLS
jgi:hypothetical protein